jgi:anti-sigma factor RsiW
MITHDSQLKIQAFLDEEASAREAAELEGLIAADPEARALLAELRNTKSALATGELELKLPESREFFWSKIEREIARQNSAPAPKMPWLAWIQRRWLPASGVALLACAVSFWTFHSRHAANQSGEMEVASDEMGSYVFRDQKHQMTMVWFYDRNAEAALAEPASMVTSGTTDFE